MFFSTDTDIVGVPQVAARIYFLIHRPAIYLLSVYFFNLVDPVKFLYDSSTVVEVTLLL